MRGLTRKHLITVLVTALLLYCQGCPEPPGKPLPPTLAGNYTGTYRLLEVDRDDTVIDSIQPVDFRFTNSTYSMKIVVVSENDRFFCDCAGDYSLVSGIQFLEADSNSTGEACLSRHNPRGGFGLDQSSLRDTLLIVQDLTADSVRTVKVLKLTPD